MALAVSNLTRFSPRYLIGAKSGTLRWLRLASRGSRGMSSAFLEPRPPIPLLAFPKITSAGKVETALVNSFATAVVDVSEAEKRIKQVLHAKFPGAVEIEVNDVSGGCGSMYQIYIEAEEFRGKKLVEQQRMVNVVLEAEIKAMHGLSLQTAVPSSSAKQK